MYTVIHNIETDEITQVPLTQDEIDAILVKRAETEKANADLEIKVKAAAAAKAALLEKLNITEDEARLLLS